MDMYILSNGFLLYFPVDFESTNRVELFISTDAFVRKSDR